MSFDKDDWRDRMNYAREALRLGVEPNEDHWALLGRVRWDWDDCEFGSAAIEPKRPYGNSDVEGDLAELLPHLTPEDRVKRHCELGAVVAGLVSGLISNRVACVVPCGDQLERWGDPAGAPITCDLPEGHGGEHLCRREGTAWQRDDMFEVVKRGVGGAQ